MKGWITIGMFVAMATALSIHAAVVHRQQQDDAYEINRVSSQIEDVRSQVDGIESLTHRLDALEQRIEAVDRATADTFGAISRSDRGRDWLARDSAFLLLQTEVRKIQGTVDDLQRREFARELNPRR